MHPPLGLAPLTLPPPGAGLTPPPVADPVTELPCEAQAIQPTSASGHLPIEHDPELEVDASLPISERLTLMFKSKFSVQSCYALEQLPRVLASLSDHSVVSLVEQATRTAVDDQSGFTHEPFVAMLKVVVRSNLIPQKVVAENILPALLAKLKSVSVETDFATLVGALVAIVPVLDSAVLLSDVLTFCTLSCAPTASSEQRLAAVDCFGALARALPETQFAPLLDRALSLCQDTLASVRTAMAMQLVTFARALVNSNPELVQSRVIPELLELCQDDSIEVRADALNALVTLVDVLPHNTCTRAVKMQAIPLIMSFYQLCFPLPATSEPERSEARPPTRTLSGDARDRLRDPLLTLTITKATQSLLVAALVPHIPSSTTSSFTPTTPTTPSTSTPASEVVLALSRVASHSDTLPSALHLPQTVLVVAARLVGPAVHAIHQSLSQAQLDRLVAHFAQLAFHEHDRVREHAALNFPALTMCALRTHQHDTVAIHDRFRTSPLASTYASLAHDKSDYVRRAIAISFHEIARLLGPDGAAIYVRHTLTALLADRSVLVLDGVASHLADTLRVCASQTSTFSLDVGSALLTAIVDACKRAAEFYRPKFRLLEQFLLQVSSATVLFDSDQLYTLLTPYLFHLASHTHSVRPVSLAAIQCLCALTRVLARAQQRLDICQRFIGEYARSSSSYSRVLFLDVVRAFCRVASARFIKNASLLDAAMGLAEDTVQVVCIGFCTLACDLKGLLRLPDDTERAQLLDSQLSRLAHASHVDVRNAAQSAQAQARTVLCVSDAQDVQREKEERALRAAEGHDSSSRHGSASSSAKGTRPGQDLSSLKAPLTPQPTRRAPTVKVRSPNTPQPSPLSTSTVAPRNRLPHSWSTVTPHSNHKRQPSSTSTTTNTPKNGRRTHTHPRPSVHPPTPHHTHPSTVLPSLATTSPNSTLIPSSPSTITTSATATTLPTKKVNKRPFHHSPPKHSRPRAPPSTPSASHTTGLPPFLLPPPSNANAPPSSSSPSSRPLRGHSASSHTNTKR